MDFEMSSILIYNTSNILFNATTTTYGMCSECARGKNTPHPTYPPPPLPLLYSRKNGLFKRFI